MKITKARLKQIIIEEMVVIISSKQNDFVWKNV